MSDSADMFEKRLDRLGQNRELIGNFCVQLQ